MDRSSAGMGFMAVFAVSGSVALLAHQFNKRLLSQFMKRIEFEFGPATYDKCQQKAKKVRFAGSSDPSSISNAGAGDYSGLTKPCLKHGDVSRDVDDEKKVVVEGGGMPLNRQVLYKGIIQQKMLFPRNGYGVPKGRPFPLCL